MIDRSPPPVTEDELHAYVDRELPADRMLAVEAWLATHPEDAVLFNAGMADVAVMIAKAILATYDFSSARVVVDVGGGRGELISTVLDAHPGLRGVLYDLPRVIEAAREKLGRAGIADRCDAIGGDILSSVPGGGDVYLLSRVIHDWDDEKSILILRNCRAAMVQTSRLLLAERTIGAALHDAKG